MSFCKSCELCVKKVVRSNGTSEAVVVHKSTRDLGQVVECSSSCQWSFDWDCRALACDCEPSQTEHSVTEAAKTEQQVVSATARGGAPFAQ